MPSQNMLGMLPSTFDSFAKRDGPQDSLKCDLQAPQLQMATVYLLGNSICLENNLVCQVIRVDS